MMNELMRKNEERNNAMVIRLLVLAVLLIGMILAQAAAAEESHAISRFGFEVKSPSIGSNNAVISTVVSNPWRSQVRMVGCTIYASNGQCIKQKTESCYRNESRFNVWYDINKELGLRLSSNTTYWYDFFVVYNSYTYRSRAYRFTTGNPQSTRPNFSFHVNTSTYSSGATIKFTVDNPTQAWSSHVGLILYDRNGRQIGSKKWNYVCNYRQFYTNFYPGHDLGVILTSRTTYYYKVYVVCNNHTYISTTMSFTTK